MYPGWSPLLPTILIPWGGRIRVAVFWLGAIIWQRALQPQRSSQNKGGMSELKKVNTNYKEPGRFSYGSQINLLGIVTPHPQFLNACR